MTPERRRFRAYDLIALLWGVVRLDQVWQARCPLHPASGRELVIRADARGLAEVWCPRGCGLETIAGARGVRSIEDWPKFGTRKEGA